MVTGAAIHGSRPSSSGRSRGLLALLGCVALAACGEARAPSPGRTLLAVTYQGHVRALLEKRCVRCHGPRDKQGGYDLSSYAGLLGPGSDGVRNALAGEASSLLLTKLDRAKDRAHFGYLAPEPTELREGETLETRQKADLELLRRWVVELRLAYFDVSVHPPGWLYPGDRNSPEFHGGALRRSGWKLALCTGCHGQELRGGSSGGSCLTCHKRGVEACTTCHGDASRGAGLLAAAPPGDLSWNLDPKLAGVGAHQAHLTPSERFAGAQCADCHVVPEKVSSAGHLDGDLRAEVVFSGLARRRGAEPVYRPLDRACAGSYCHGDTLKDPTAQPVAFFWTSTTPPACNACHGMPGQGIGNAECQLCHAQSVAACTPGEAGCLTTGRRPSDGELVGVRFHRPSLHVDGKAPIGRADATGSCDGCHGTGPFGAPGPDLRGHTEPSAPGVGLHAIHLKGSATAGPLGCVDCHQVPQTVTAVGHIDPDLRAEVTFGEKARGPAGSRERRGPPTYDAKALLCSNVWCHAVDGAQVKEWSWTAPTALACNACHGQPPTRTSKGLPHPVAQDCKGCHVSAFSPDGQLDPAKHPNGRVDL